MISSHSNGRVALLFATGVLAFAPLERAAAQCELDVVNASDAAGFDNFGFSIAMDGDFTIVGAPGNNRLGREFVPNYIFRRVGSSWVQDAILAPEDVSPRSLFGSSVAISGDVAVAGAFLDGHSDSDPSDGAGSAYVYTFNGNNWVQEAKLAASDATMANLFGWAVSARGDRIVVGAIAPNRADDNAGSAYVFERAGAMWVERARLTASDAQGYDFFGSSIEIHGSRVFVGAQNRGHSGETTTDGMGAVYVFEFDGAEWAQEAILTVADLPTRASFGGSLAASGDTLLVGAQSDDWAGPRAGAVHVFQRVGTTWVHDGRLVGDDTGPSDRFGTSVSIDGDFAVIGASNTQNGQGAVYVFRRNGTTWNQMAKITASQSTGQDFFGFSVSLAGDFLAVGASVADSPPTNSGAAYFYRILGAADCNSNLVNDSCELDCNGNGFPDDCDIAGGTSDDCNDNGIPDGCEVDCNENTVPDSCDIGTGTSDDCNQNSIPDECELDCNDNGVADDCDIAAGGSIDCDANGIPDECEPDCNANDVADTCDIASNNSADCNENSVPDECEPNEDCNSNGIQDICDIASGHSLDCNHNSVPDTCDLASGLMVVTSVDGLVGHYGGFVGQSQTSAFDFQMDFASISQAGLCVEVPFGGVEFFGTLDGVRGPGFFPTYPVSTHYCVPLPVTETVLDGTGIVRLIINVGGCCDLSTFVTNATIWFMPDADDDGDGLFNTEDNCPMHPNPDQADCDTDGKGDVCTLAECTGDPACSDCDLNQQQDGCDPDVDGDGMIDACDACPTDAAKVAPGECGCGTPDNDTDLDTILDCNDRCPNEDDLIDLNANGQPDCLEDISIPTLSTWGMVTLALLLLTVARRVYSDRPATQNGR